ncbi:NAD(P)H-dependent oxidoreductase [Methylovulum miyakonense]|uniref:NAD(P)H-dependent oxidoreductase n=1 Tax=Methylovulum miyakonense TaxID=645578 RepID=UPI0003A5EA99|nr:NAD(P)H-dependent oxidoreductase [Methylovulum miyakonense]
METKHIALIQGHPDPAGNRFCHALAAAYIKGAQAAGHNVQLIDIAHIQFPILRTYADFYEGVAPESLQQARQTIQSAQHLVVIYPLWLGSMPAYLKAFIEQVFRPGFAIDKGTDGLRWKKLLAGKTAHIVVTMGMPAIIFRWYYLAHSLKSLERNILQFCGIKPTQETLIGRVDSMDDSKRKQWLAKMELLGRSGK